MLSNYPQVADAKRSVDHACHCEKRARVGPFPRMLRHVWRERSRDVNHQAAQCKRRWLLGREEHMITLFSIAAGCAGMRGTHVALKWVSHRRALSRRLSELRFGFRQA